MSFSTHRYLSLSLEKRKRARKNRRTRNLSSTRTHRTTIFWREKGKLLFRSFVVAYVHLKTEYSTERTTNYQSFVYRCTRVSRREDEKIKRRRSESEPPAKRNRCRLTKIALVCTYKKRMCSRRTRHAKTVTVNYIRYIRKTNIYVRLPQPANNRQFRNVWICGIEIVDERRADRDACFPSSVTINETYNL